MAIKKISKKKASVEAIAYQKYYFSSFHSLHGCVCECANEQFKYVNLNESLVHKIGGECLDYKRCIRNIFRVYSLSS